LPTSGEPIIFEPMTERWNRRGAQRPWIHGLVAAILAVLFVGAGAIDAYGLHRCPHHDALPGEAGIPAAAGQSAGHAAIHTGATHTGGVPGQAAHGDASDEQGHGEHGPCSCIGLCGAATAALPGFAARALEPLAITADAVSLRLTQSLTIARADYLLPFANAPPSAR
jgi:hypothetical protein